MVQESTLIQLWLFALILLVITSMSKREGQENEDIVISESTHTIDDEFMNQPIRMGEKTASTTERKCDGSGGVTRVAYNKGDVNGIGEAAAKVIRTGMYEGVYNVHSEACYALTAYKENLLGELEKIMKRMVDCSSIEEFKQLLEHFEEVYAGMLADADKVGATYNMDTEPLKKLLKKYKKLLIARLSEGELPDEEYLRTQFDKFTKKFCSGIPTDRSTGIADEFFSRGMSQREERVDETATSEERDRPPPAGMFA